MDRRELPIQALLLGTTLAAIYCLKRHASTASAEELRWLLTPTAALVERFGAGRFVWVAGEGYLDAEARFLIAPACAGANFLAAVLLTAAAVVAGRSASLGARCATFVAACAVAWGVTIVVNAFRITLAMALHQHPWWTSAFLSAPDAHRLLGIVLYAGTLTALYAVTRRGRKARDQAWTGLAFPLGCYAVVTVGLPALNGALARPDFSRHAALVATGATGILALGTAIRCFGPRKRQRQSA